MAEIVVQDEQKMLDKIKELPQQLENAWTSLWTKDLKIGEFNSVLIVGLGGSGIAGELAQELYLASPVPITTWANYGLPGWANAKTLVVAVSYSGDTEETIDAVKAALERQCPLVAVTSGGKLLELAQTNNFPVAKIDYTSTPRSAIGWLYGLVATLLAKINAGQLTEKQYFEALSELKKTVEDTSFAARAQEMAMNISNKVPLILAAPPLTAVARRWVTQLNENSKSLAVSLFLPEMSHNAVVGLDFPIPEKLTGLLLESNFGFSRSVARQKVIEKWFAKKEIPLVPLSVRCGSLLAEQLLLLHFGDLLSYYVAGVYGIDPTPVEPVNFIKEELKKI